MGRYLKVGGRTLSQVKFIADLHWNHVNMAIKRGFDNVKDHNDYIVQQWNSAVHKRDIVYILGDLTMEKGCYAWLDRLNGIKKVVLGNHDFGKHIPELLKYVQSVAGMVRYSRKGYPKMWLTHCPVHPKELEFRVGYNIHGHIHENFVKGSGQIHDSRYICVSCEHVDYTPKLIEELNINPLTKG